MILPAPGRSSFAHGEDEGCDNFWSFIRVLLLESYRRNSYSLLLHLPFHPNGLDCLIPCNIIKLKNAAHAAHFTKQSDTRGPDLMKHCVY